MITVTRNLQRARHQLDLFDKDQSKLEEFDEEYEQLSFLSEQNSKLREELKLMNLSLNDFIEETR